MTNNTALLRSMVVYAVCLPLAIVVGYMISEPTDQWSDAVLSVVLFLLLLPLLFRWYHAWLITIWNMAIVFVFLPGLLPGWMPIACVGFAVAVGHYILNRDRKFLASGSVSLSLVMLAIVVAITAQFRGGLGFRALGDDAIGGKRYLFIWLAVVAYFALISQRIPLEKRKLYTMLFLLGSTTQIFGDIGSYLGPAFRFVYVFFPGSTLPSLQPNLVGPEAIQRFGGVAGFGMAVAMAVVARYGIEGILDLRKIWRLLFFAAGLLLSTFGGYRSIVIAIGLTLVLVFYFEGLFRSRLMPIMLLGVILAGGLVVSFAERLPSNVQRCLAFLPIKIDPAVRMNAEATSEWRLEMWEALEPQIPRYLLLGKGLTFNSNDLDSYRTLGSNQVGGEVGGQSALAGDYHNGPLSVIIPFGIWGAIVFIWFLVASIRVLWANYKYGDPEIRKINTFLLSYFVTKTIVFLFVFGGFYSEMIVFVGLIGFSITLNGGVAKAVPAIHTQPVTSRFRSRLLERPVMSH